MVGRLPCRCICRPPRFRDSSFELSGPVVSLQKRAGGTVRLVHPRGRSHRRQGALLSGRASKREIVSVRERGSRKGSVRIARARRVSTLSNPSLSSPVPPLIKTKKTTFNECNEFTQSATRLFVGTIQETFTQKKKTGWAAPDELDFHWFPSMPDITKPQSFTKLDCRAFFSASCTHWMLAPDPRRAGWAHKPGHGLGSLVIMRLVLKSSHSS